MSAEASRDALVAAVSAAERSAIGRARDAGPAAVPALASLLQTAGSDEVREIAAYCLGQIAAPEASRALVPALLDRAMEVHAAAGASLERRCDPSAHDALFDAYDRADDPGVRARTLRILGTLDARVDLDALRACYDAETAAEPRELGLVALARCGDPRARRDFVAALLGARGTPTLRRWLDHAEYARGPWLLPALRALLDAEDPVIALPKHAPDDPFPSTLRACDLAVQLVAAITSRGFSFPLDAPANYTPAQRAEVRATLAATEA